MRVVINGTQTNIPTSLSEITLQQRIDYQRQHGDELDEMLKNILQLKEDEQELELPGFILEKSIRTVSFFTGVTVSDIRESEYVQEILSYAAAANKVLFEQEDEMKLEREFLFNGEIWHLHPVELKNGDKMKFGELIDAKQMVKQMIDLGANQWEYLLPLCAIYLRKKDETYQESFLYEDSERLELMKKLPMDIAMQVGFFLLGTVNIFLNTSRSSGQVRLKTEEAGTRKNTMTHTAGLIS